MGLPHLVEEPIVFIGTLFSDETIFDQVLPLLQDKFGKILFQSDIQPWEYSDHYNRELGNRIFRRFIFFNEIIDPSALSDIKLLTNDIEAIYAQDGKRRVNLDPGYITLAKVVLASTKNYSHRIYLGKGIYAELALFFKDNKFIAMPYTYYDYKDQSYLGMFIEVRNLLKSMHGKKAYNLKG